jgi:hypothetical protein
MRRGWWIRDPWMWLIALGVVVAVTVWMGGPRLW